MSKGSYFGIQALWSFVLSVAIWYFTLKDLQIGPYEVDIDDSRLVIFAVGSIVYLVLTIVYIVIGRRKVRSWSGWMIVVSLLISVTIGFLGSFGAIYGSEWIHKLSIRE